MSIQLRGLDPAVRAYAQWCLDVAALYKVPVTVTSGLRSWAEQTALRARYEACLARGEPVEPSNPNSACRYPANQPGDSAHNFGWAWDSWVEEPYRAWWTAVRQYAGFRVPSHDWIHAEVPDWRALAPTVTRRG